MANSLKDTIDIIKPQMKFKSSKHMDSKEQINWVPVFRWKETWNMGISENGDWLIELGEDVYELSSPRAYLRVEILLEQPIIDLRKKVEQFFYELNVTIDGYDVFPFVEIVRAVFEETSSYWIELGFKWFDELPLQKKVMLMEPIAKMIDRKVIPQKIRHKARTELKRLCST